MERIKKYANAKYIILLMLILLVIYTFINYAFLSMNCNGVWYYSLTDSNGEDYWYILRFYDDSTVTAYEYNKRKNQMLLMPDTTAVPYKKTLTGISVDTKAGVYKMKFNFVKKTFTPKLFLFSLEPYRRMKVDEKIIKKMDSCNTFKEK